MKSGQGECRNGSPEKHSNVSEVQELVLVEISDEGVS